MVSFSSELIFPLIVAIPLVGASSGLPSWLFSKSGATSCTDAVGINVGGGGVHGSLADDEIEVPGGLVEQLLGRTGPDAGAVDAGLNRAQLIHNTFSGYYYV